MPEHLGDYHIVREIGRGGMGIDKVLARLDPSRACDLRSSPTLPLATSPAALQRIEETTAVVQALVQGEFYRRRPEDASSVVPAANAVVPPSPPSASAAGGKRPPLPSASGSARGKRPQPPVPSDWRSRG